MYPLRKRNVKKAKERQVWTKMSHGVCPQQHFPAQWVDRAYAEQVSRTVTRGTLRALDVFAFLHVSALVETATVLYVARTRHRERVDRYLVCWRKEARD